MSLVWSTSLPFHHLILQYTCTSFHLPTATAPTIPGHPAFKLLSSHTLQTQCAIWNSYTMPWSRLRTPRPGDATGALRRQSTLDPLASPEHHEQISNSSPLRLGHDPLDSVKTPSPLRNSFEPSAVEQAANSIERAQDPMLPEQPQKRQRFSMLKYRHASDPQVRFSLLRPP